MIFNQAGYILSLQYTAISFAVCSLITLLSGIISQNFESYRTLNPGLQKEWRCRAVALAHSVFANIAITYSMLNFPQKIEFSSKYLLLKEDSIAFSYFNKNTAIIPIESDMLRLTESFCCGYFLWDTAIMLYYWKAKGTDYFGLDGLIHGTMCSIVYLVTLVSLTFQHFGCHDFF